MKTQAICAGLTLLVFVLVESKSAVRPPGSCQYELMKRCNHQFKDIFEFQAALGNKSDAVYCQGLQSFMDCLEDDPCHGILIDNYRFMVMEHGMMDKKMKVCPKHQYEKLRKKVSTDTKFKHIAAGDDIEFENPDLELEPCAQETHRKCIHVFSNGMETESNMCSVITGFIKCYRDASPCKATIVQKFAHLCGQLGQQMVRINKLHPGVMC